MQSLIRNSRFWILLFAAGVILAVAINYGLFSATPQYGKLVRTYAFWASGLLMLALFISPIVKLFPKFPRKAELIHARRAIGVSAAMFAFFHAWFAFFKQLGGFPGLSFLTQRYLVAITVSSTALLILIVLTFTSFDAAVKKLGPWWKRIHKFVYLAGFLVLYHAFSIGSHFTDLRTPIARLILILIFTLLLFQAIRFDQKWRPQGMRIGIFTMGVLVAAPFTLATFAGTPISQGISIHSQHGALLTPTAQPVSTSQKRYSVSLSTEPANPQPGQPTTLRIRVFDAASGTQITRFTQLYEQFMHIIIVDNQLEDFQHIHPTTTAEGALEVVHTFAHDGLYRIYFNFIPFQDTEQQVGATVSVGSGKPTTISDALRADTEFDKKVGDYTISSGQHVLPAANVSAGLDPLVYSVTGPGQVLLAPYIGAFGHLTLINMDTYEFVHAHPKDMKVPKPDERAAPLISFYVMSNGVAIKPGRYRAFVELAPNEVRTQAAFTLTFE